MLPSLREHKTLGTLMSDPGTPSLYNLWLLTLSMREKQ